jgi:hypothetical protein
VGDAERPGEPELQLRVLRRPCGRRRRGCEGDQCEEDCEKTAVHAESIFWPRPVGVKKMGLCRAEDSPGGPCAGRAQARYLLEGLGTEVDSP